MRLSIALHVEVPDATRIGDLSDALTHAKKKLQGLQEELEGRLPKNGRGRGRVRLEPGPRRRG